MLTKIIESGTPQKNNAPPSEGEIYKNVETFGRRFELKYGYYDDKDRQSPLCEPTVIYPDFINQPIYTDNGEPFVTVMQDACRHYRGGAKRTADTTCSECKYFTQGEDWFGICICTKNRKTE